MPCRFFPLNDGSRMPELKVIQPTPSQPELPGRAPSRGSHVKSVALRIYRLGVIVAIVWLIQRHQTRLRVEGSDPIKIEEARSFFPSANRLVPDASERMGQWVMDSQGQAVGYVLRTSPASDKIVGYSGPTDTLVALTPDKTAPKVLGIKVRHSLDTKQHVADVVADEYFMGTWNGKSWDQVAGMDPRAAGIEGVSGASLTSMSIANGIRRRFQMSERAAQASAEEARHPPHFGAGDIGLVVIIAIAIVFTFTHLRSKVWLRRAFQVGLIGYLGFVNGQILAPIASGRLGRLDNSLACRARAGASDGRCADRAMDFAPAGLLLAHLSLWRRAGTGGPSESSLDQTPVRDAAGT